MPARRSLHCRLMVREGGSRGGPADQFVHPPVRTSVVQAFDVAEANAWGDSRFLPLGRRFGYCFRGVEGPWGRAELISVTEPCLIEHCDGERVLYVPLGVGRAPLVWGKEVPHTSLLPLPAARPVSARIPGPTEYASVTLPTAANPLDEALDQRLLRPGKQALARLQRLVRTVFDVVDVGADASAVDGVGEAIVDATHLATVGEQGGRDGPLVSSSSRVVAEAMDAVQEGRAGSISEICAACGVSRSSLYRAFDEVLGMSPYAWVQLQRLTRLRTALSTADPAPGVVSREAAAVGAYHLGHLSRAYRHLFGETPVETLRRR